MRPHLLRSLAITLCVLGVALIVAGAGGTWGVAYGQTAGPTPTPATAISPLSAVKSVVPTRAAANETFTFTIQARNDSAQPQTNIVVTDRLLDFLEPVSVSTTKGTATTSGQEIRVNVGTLAPGEVVTVTIMARIRTATQPGATGVNEAQITSTDGSGAGGGSGGGSGGVSHVLVTNQVAVLVSSGGLNPPEDGPPIGLPTTGAEPTSSLLLLGLGALLLAAGAGLSLLARRTPAAKG